MWFKHDLNYVHIQVLKIMCTYIAYIFKHLHLIKLVNIISIRIKIHITGDTCSKLNSILLNKKAI